MTATMSASHRTEAVAFFRDQAVTRKVNLEKAEAASRHEKGDFSPMLIQAADTCTTAAFAYRLALVHGYGYDEARAIFDEGLAEAAQAKEGLTIDAIGWVDF